MYSLPKHCYWKQQRRRICFKALSDKPYDIKKIDIVLRLLPIFAGVLVALKFLKNSNCKMDQFTSGLSEIKHKRKCVK